MTVEMKGQIESLMKKKSDLRFEERSDGKEAELYIYGPIGGFFFSDNSAQSIRRKLQDTKAETIHVHINSGGGSAFDGVAIMNQLKNHKAEIIVHVDGLAASAASVIAMAGDKVIMPENTMMMIHRASTIGFGNASEFEKLSNDLKKIDKSLAASYNDRFVGEQEELDQLLDDETWMTADEAVAFGLADEVTDEIEIQETEDLDEEDEEVSEPEGEYENVKDRLVAKYKSQKNEKETEQTEPDEPVRQNLAGLFLHL